MDMPCHEALWTAETCFAWSELRTSLAFSFSNTLRSLISPLEIQVLPCSAFGRNIILSGLLQQIWQLRQASSPQEDLLELPKFEIALQKWQNMVAKTEAPTPAGSRENHTLFHDSIAMLRLAHVMLCLDSSRLKTIVCSQDVNGIAEAMRTRCPEVQRTKLAVNVALVAIDAFRSIVRSGINIIAKTGSLKISPQVYLCWFDHGTPISGLTRAILLTHGSPVPQQMAASSQRKRCL